MSPTQRQQKAEFMDPLSFNKVRQFLCCVGGSVQGREKGGGAEIPTHVCIESGVGDLGKMLTCSTHEPSLCLTYIL